jgi:ATP-dependent Zn protease
VFTHAVDSPDFLKVSLIPDHQYKNSTISKLPVNKPEKPQHSPSIPTQSLEEITITPTVTQVAVNLTSGKKPAGPTEVLQAAKKRKTDEQISLPVVPTAVSILGVRSNTPQPTTVVVPPPATYAAMSAASKPKRFKKEVKCINVSTTFDDIGGMDKTLTELCELLVHVKHPAIYRTIGLPPPRGFLLHGPPGCGKTLLAHSIAGVSWLTLTNSLSRLLNSFFCRPSTYP